MVFLNYLERLFVSSPWPIILLAVMLAIVYFGSRNMQDHHRHCPFDACLIGLAWPLERHDGDARHGDGVYVHRHSWWAFRSASSWPGLTGCRAIINPILDVMQTMPSFVYLIPVVMIFGIGKVPGLIAVVIYAVPPMIRLTNLGIRLVDKEVLEAADAFGSSGWQKLKNVQMPLALPTIMAGINQTIMMSLAMVVVASMVGVGGLGRNVLQAINNQFFTVGFFNGFALVAIAIIFDRTSQAYGRRLQKHSEVIHG